MLAAVYSNVGLGAQFDTSFPSGSASSLFDLGIALMLSSLAMEEIQCKAGPRDEDLRWTSGRAIAAG